MFRNIITSIENVHFSFINNLIFMLMIKSKPAVIILFMIVVIAFYSSCSKDDFFVNDTMLTKSNLSEYGIYVGNPTHLVPSPEYKLYEISSQLFTDYAEKQRLIKIPTGTKPSALDNGLLSFPEGTIIVKTFYYFNDKRNPSLGKKLIETRILELSNGKWIAGTYKWNDAQTDAILVSAGFNQTVNWIDEYGKPKVVAYHVPGNLECKTCHNSNNSVIPIGPKVRNLNFNVQRNSQTINQLIHFQNEGLLNSANPSDFSTIPDYTNPTVTLEKRARAYLDINCAHCHNSNGFASRFRYRMDYETDLNTSKIKEGKAAIRYMMENGDMPKIGTTVIDKEGVELIKQYLETL